MEAKISGEVQARVLRAEIRDEAGDKADQLRVTLANPDARLAIPDKGAQLTARLGHVGHRELYGVYVVDSVRSRGGAGRTLEIVAKAADMTRGLKVLRTKAWKNITLGEVVGEIAARHGLEARVSTELAGVPMSASPYAQFDQVDESDLHFLRRLADDHGAVTKPTNGRLIFVRNGEARPASGRTIAPVVVRESDVSSWSATAPDRQQHRSVRAGYRSDATQEQAYVTEGEGEPVLELAQPYADEAAARAAAKSRLRRIGRSNATLGFECAGDVALRAEHPLTFVGRDPLASGDWVINSVTHTVDEGGFRSRVEAGVRAS